jgi:5-phospho-D-xylono-1,4-lactonase
MSSVIRTVVGEIVPEELGLTDIHDHLIGTPPQIYASKDSDLILRDETAAAAELERFKKAGGNALVEFTTPDYGRDPAALRRLSNKTGIHIIAVTGFNKGKFSSLLIADRSIEDVSDQILRDFGKPGMDETGVHPGVVKAATSLNGMTKEEEVSLHVAARVHRETGVPVMNHTEAGTFGNEQLDILTSEGVSPQKITLCHLDRNMDFDYLISLAKRGCFLSFDQVGKTKYASDEARAVMLLSLIRAGYGKQLLIGGDYARLSYWQSFNGSLGPSYLLTNFVPLLQNVGLSQQEVNDILIYNPRRALTIG